MVTEKFRGQGLAKKLYGMAEAHLKEFEVPEVQLMVWGFNDTAIGLYDNLGFHPLFHRMRKKLD